MDEPMQNIPTSEGTSGSQGYTGAEDMKEDSQDVDKNKGMAIIAYFVFFIPLLVAKDSKFAMYHANQGLLLFLTVIAVNIIGGVIPFLGWFVILPLGMVFSIVLWLMGIINAAQGKMKPLPLIGGISILK